MVHGDLSHGRSAKKGNGKHGGGGKNQTVVGKHSGPADPVPPTPRPPPTVQQYDIAGTETFAAGHSQNGSIMDVLNQMRAEAASAARMQQEQLDRVIQKAADAEERVSRLEKKCEFLTTTLAQVQLQYAAVNCWADNLGTRLNMVESYTAGDRAAATAIVDNVVSGGEAPPFSAEAAAAITSALPEGDIHMGEETTRGQKAPREESPSDREDPSDGRPRAKRFAPQEDFESVTDADEASKL